MELDINKPREGIAAIMRKAGVHPALIHAHLKTGLIVGEDSPHTPAKRKEWTDAVQEWYDANESSGGGQ